MAYITLNTPKLKDNYQKLDQLFRSAGIEWAVVAKMLCGNPLYLQQLLKLGIRQICDSRIDNLQRIKALSPNVETIFIRPPAKRNADRIVAFADISFNTELETILTLSEAAVAQGKTHRVVIMIELGELREGVLHEDFIGFFRSVLQMPNIEVAGIGANLTCMYGVLPSEDKMLQLCLYRDLVEATFGCTIPYVSGGASVTIPLIGKGQLPKGINHFRVGETLFLGTDVYNNKPLAYLHGDVFRLYAEIIELNEKPLVPAGDLGRNLCGKTASFDDALRGCKSYRAIVDMGLLDVEDGHVQPVSPDQSIAGASSDMLVIDLGTNARRLKVGDLIEFRMDYMGVLRIMHSDYVEKRLESVIPQPELRAILNLSEAVASVN